MVRRSLLGALALLVTTGCAVLLLHDPRRDIDLGRWADPADAWTRSVMPNAREATGELCGEELPCDQAVTSDTLTMYRFPRREDTVAAAGRFGEDAYLSGWIVVRFEPGGLAPGVRNDIEYAVGCTNTWVSEDGRDC